MRRNGIRGFLAWLAYYVELSRVFSIRHRYLWALSNIVQNRQLYGNYAPPEFQP